jgi:molecular chaperone DnaJ
MSSGCHSCSSSGFIIKNPCDSCRGTGCTRKNITVNIDIPAGICDGNVLKLSGIGNFEPGATVAGDCFIEIVVDDHNAFKREGSDISSNIEISYYQAVIGAKIKADFIDARLDIKIPPGTQPGDIISIPDMGLPIDIGSSERGFHNIHIRLIVPSDVSDEESDLIKKLEEIRLQRD